ncbi:hypothetical protein EVAR_26682_1 [Eumeta japonica]|uniref:Uncharacterized protein n=1 Tax=Eumeta variegata TaxID=151549 RepID=A0A4C1VN72_EUMVA|nr:hypothetical protein EVAR_26682_1 [Eumeta japonica]
MRLKADYGAGLLGDIRSLCEAFSAIFRPIAQPLKIQPAKLCVGSPRSRVMPFDRCRGRGVRLTQEYGVSCRCGMVGLVADRSTVRRVRRNGCYFRTSPGAPAGSRLCTPGHNSRSNLEFATNMLISAAASPSSRFYAYRWLN